MGLPTEPVFYITWTAIWVAIVTTLALSIPKEKYANYSKYVFLALVIPVMLSTLYLAGNTVNKNLNSVTGGPIHWHMDYYIYVCGERLDLVNPTGLANKIGTPLFHEHNDNRVHVEGTVDEIKNVNLGSYFKVVGGEISASHLIYDIDGPEIVEVHNGDLCNGEPSELKVYVNGQKITDPASYMYYPHAQVPPGDCVIVEFGPNLPDTTQRTCDFWEVNGWNYDNFKEKRKANPNYKPSWMGDGYEYIDGLGVVEVNS